MCNENNPETKNMTGSMVNGLEMMWAITSSPTSYRTKKYTLELADTASLVCGNTPHVTC